MKQTRMRLFGAMLVLGVFIWLAISGSHRTPSETRETDDLVERPSKNDSVGRSSPSAAPTEAAQLWSLNNPPIVFYGRTVDQSGNPIPGVEIRAGVQFGLLHKVGHAETSTRSDADGRFEISGMEGSGLGLDLRKNGYEFVPFNSYFRYAMHAENYHRPDPNVPVDIMMWKQQGAENLIRYIKTWRFPSNAEPLRINLESARTDEVEADLIVRIFRDPLRVPFGAQGFEWRVSVDVIGGGLIAVGDRQYYNLAPEDGYVPKFERRQERQNWNDVDEGKIKRTWTERVEEVFFVRSRDGKNFARIKLLLQPNADRNEGDNEAVVTADVWLNPNGSRNLEYDSDKAITPPGADR